MLSEEQRLKRNAYQRAWAAANKDKVAAIDRKKYLKVAGTEKRRAHGRKAMAEWRAKNPEKTRIANEKNKEPQRARYKKNGREQKLAWRRANKNKANELNRAWKAANPDKIRAANRNRKATKKSAEGRHTAADIASIYKSQKGKCAYCRCKLGDDYHVDHIVPLKLGGTNWSNNLQLTCETCNCSKRAAHPIEYAQSIGRLL